MATSLNPSFNGIWSASVSDSEQWAIDRGVLILVLMEYGLRVQLVLLMLQLREVLILVLMEYGLRDIVSFLEGSL